MSESGCDTGAGMYHKSVIVSGDTKMPLCIPPECKTPVMLEPGHVYGENAPLYMVNPDAKDNLYRPWKPGDGWEHGALLCCAVDATKWTEACEVFAVKDPGDCNGIVMDAIGWPAEGRTEAEFLHIRSTSGCCWKWRSLPRPNTKIPCPPDCVVEPPAEEGEGVKEARVA